MSICLSSGSSDDGRETPGTTDFVVWSACGCQPEEALRVTQIS